jgi:hypothetical protein
LPLRMPYIRLTVDKATLQRLVQKYTTVTRGMNGEVVAFDKYDDLN